MLCTLKDPDLCVQIWPNAQGPIYLSELMKCPMLPSSVVLQQSGERMLWRGTAASSSPSSSLLVAAGCCLVSLLTFWFQGLSWETTSSAQKGEVLHASLAL